MDKDLKQNVELKTVPKKKVLRRFPVFQILLVIALVSFGILTLLVSTNLPYLPLDLVVTREIQLIKSPVFYNAMHFITFIGNMWPGSIVIGFFFLCLLYLKKVKAAFLLILSGFGAALLAQVIKSIVQRPRPDPLLILQDAAKFNDPGSFPSGHVLFAIGIYGFLFFLTFTLFKRNIGAIVLTVLELLMIILMGLSRIYLGAHWFSDVLGSILIGFAWMYLMAMLYRLVIKT